MKKKVTVQNKSGLHARPASMLVKTATEFESDFHIHMMGYTINGKSILGVLTLAAEEGAELELEFNGKDEKEAMEAVSALFENNFSIDEDEED